MITVNKLRKEFFIPDAVKGPLGMLRGLVSRSGKTVLAVNDIDFTIDSGEFVGYIGPNGAGKSTTIKMLTGILHPTSGTVEIAGLSPQKHREQVVRHLGVVFGQRTQLWWDLPLIESFELLAAMYQVPGKTLQRKLETFNDLLSLGEFWDTPVRKLSLGQRMRGEICASLLHNPDVLFLDEPTIGLDVVAKAAIRGFLKEINDNGVTILLTTHDLGDIEKLCKRVMVINHGSILFDGGVDGLKSQIGSLSQLIVDFEDAIDSTAITLPSGVSMEAHSPSQLHISFDRAAISPNAILRALNGSGVIRDIHIVEPDIETAVAKLF